MRLLQEFGFNGGQGSRAHDAGSDGVGSREDGICFWKSRDSSDFGKVGVNSILKTEVLTDQHRTRNEFVKTTLNGERYE